MSEHTIVFITEIPAVDNNTLSEISHAYKEEKAREEVAEQLVDQNVVRFKVIDRFANDSLLSPNTVVLPSGVIVQPNLNLNENFQELLSRYPNAYIHVYRMLV